jgi:hypothetical protein
MGVQEKLLNFKIVSSSVWSAVAKHHKLGEIDFSLF